MTWNPSDRSSAANSAVQFVAESATVLLDDLADEGVLVDDNFASEGDIEILKGNSQQVSVMDGAKCVGGGRSETGVTDAGEIGRDRNHRKARTRSLYSVVFFKVMPRTQDLDVLSVFGRAAQGIRDYVIEMKILFAPAFHTAALITFPDYDFDCRGNYTVVIDTGSKIRNGQQGLIDDLKLELKYLASIRVSCQASTSLKRPLYTQIPFRFSLGHPDSFRLCPFPTCTA